ncbi:TetR/AcrR family transcriptional regulator [Amycolatopsis endophytica]|uniref:AcrR family transcriptional regulator n=1 Tax=Amycolatopsis endophytica TaxID=860233 RepID=A0A853BBE8_9PSEU|nr:TetR/AcrR family transcriptional regulator [Amycolatopsis endophytica]NYI92072.1 AcrR family transcriptional regulator [Amycolatopsis endophytica]
MTEYSASGDPKRSFELLWGLHEAPSRGPKARFTVEEVTRVAIRLADAAGLTAVSMRRVAEELGASTMSLYTYVPGKAELLDLMIDTVVGETARPDDVPGGWRGGLEHLARENAALTLVLGYVQSAMRGVVEAGQAARRSGRSDVQWWESYAPLLEKVFDPDRFPLAARVGASAGEAYQAPSDPHAFEFGLARILDGIEALINGRDGKPGAPRPTAG